MNLKILYSDDHLAVISKPPEFLSVPGRGPEKADAVTTRIRSIFPESPEHPEVHRLDMSTSGLMVLALSIAARRALSIDFQRHRIFKRYEALVEGVPRESAGVIALPFRLDPDNRPLQVYDPDRGKLGITRWDSLGSVDGITRLCLIPLTGRTHQLRVHCAHALGLDSPILGDRLYGSGGPRLHLHAAELRFIHPQTDKEMAFRSEVPF